MRKLSTNPNTRQINNLDTLDNTMETNKDTVIEISEFDKIKLLEIEISETQRKMQQEINRSYIVIQWQISNAKKTMKEVLDKLQFDMSLQIDIIEKIVEEMK